MCVFVHFLVYYYLRFVLVIASVNRLKYKTSVFSINVNIIIIRIDKMIN